MQCDLCRYRNVSADMRRGTSLRYPLKEKKRIVHNLTVHGAPTRNSQLNGVEQHKKPLTESFSAVTIQSETEVSVDAHSDHTPITNGTSESLRPQALSRVIGSEGVTRTGSLEDVRRSSSSAHRQSIASRSLSLPIKDEKTVSLSIEPEKPKRKLDKDNEFSQLRDTPALQFLTRKDLYKYMTSAGVRFLLIIITFKLFVIGNSVCSSRILC